MANLFSTMKSRMGSRAPEEAFGLGARLPLTKPMAKQIPLHIARLVGADLSGYTFERRRSNFQDAKSDLVIYDGSGATVLKGREANWGLSFWE